MRNIYVCKYPPCQKLVSVDFSMHHSFKENIVENYAKNELGGPFQPCADSLCHRLGYDQSANMLIGGISLDVSALSQVTNPKYYCTRKHASATQVHIPSLQIVELPKNVTVSVNCNKMLGNMCNELHNTYPYNPVIYNDLWFHTLYHVIMYLKHKKHPKLLEEIRKCTSMAAVKELVNSRSLGYSEDDETEFYGDLEKYLQTLLVAKFFSNFRMYNCNVALFYSKAAVTYHNCIDGLIEPERFNDLFARELMLFSRTLLDKVT